MVVTSSLGPPSGPWEPGLAFLLHRRGNRNSDGMELEEIPGGEQAKDVNKLIGGVRIGSAEIRASLSRILILKMSSTHCSLLAV